MKKLAVLFVTMLFVAGSAFAQENIKVGVGANLALPMGTFGDWAKMGFGGQAQGEMGISGYTGTASVGYMTFGAKEIGVPGFATSKTTLSVIPVLVGGKYSFMPGVYGQVAVGLNFVSLDVESSTTLFGRTVNVSGSTSETKFGYALGVGYEMQMIDIAVKYQALASDANMLGLSVMYKFGL